MRAIARRSIDEGISGAIIDLAGSGAEHRAERGAEQQEVQAFQALRQRADDQAALHLGGQHCRGSLPAFELDDAVAGQARRVDDAVDAAEAGFGFGQHRFHVLKAAYVRAQGQHLAAQGFDVFDFP